MITEAPARYAAGASDFKRMDADPLHHSGLF
jgi:hypothetical protein